MAGSDKGKRINPRSHKNNAKLLPVKLECLTRYSEGQSYRQIGVALGISYGTARNYVLEMLDEYQMPAVDEYRRKVLKDSEAQLARLHELKATPQYVVSAKGTYVLGPDGEPVLDQDHVLKVEALIIKLRAETSRMLGANAPAQAQLTVTTVDPGDLAISPLVAAQRAKNAQIMGEFQGTTDTP